MKPKTFVLRTADIIQNLAKYLCDNWEADGVLWEVVIRPFRDTRSKRQNRYYWKVIELIGNHFGYTDEEAHEYFKSEFLKSNEREIFGKETAIYGSTTKLTKAEFSAYMEQIGRLCAENGFIVPPPLALGYEL